MDFLNYNLFYCTEHLQTTVSTLRNKILRPVLQQAVGIVVFVFVLSLCVKNVCHLNNPLMEGYSCIVKWVKKTQKGSLG